MIRIHPYLAALAAAAGLAACAASGVSQVAAPVDSEAASFVPPEIEGYLTAADLDGAALIGPPPAPDSPRGRSDAARFAETRALEGSARWKKAAADADLWGGKALKGYACAAGLDVNPKTTPVTVHVLERVEQDVRTIGTPAKDHYGRPRPLIGHDAPICVARAEWMKTNASYPSGHSMTGWAWALVLAELAPAKANELMAAGKEMGTSRVICGVHYESDVEAGRDLAAAMVARMHGDAEFRADMEKARREVARLSGPPSDCGG
ncbi:phosphatase PAP2 family protein [Phenylobacterium sp.]|uniref:acid phosphatase n=1 Tax=Phenylobacterium sp. TaxID=1871053 RepID=UPI0019CB3126|nr:phosphatase PAP2 family protein [Phenylobacterium sp.]MBC7168999.1 phosphatase PAP2 family protein [Phenylobacterium sp.]